VPAYRRLPFATRGHYAAIWPRRGAFDQGPGARYVLMDGAGGTILQLKK
jgi:hypothetical protein